MKVEIGSVVDGHEVLEVGKAYALWGSLLTPVKFTDHKFGVVLSCDETKTRIWCTDLAEAKQAIENATQMPTVTHGIGSEVIRVIGQDTTGPFLVNMYYNAKDREHGRQDELLR